MHPCNCGRGGRGDRDNGSCSCGDGCCGGCNGLPAHEVSARQVIRILIICLFLTEVNLPIVAEMPRRMVPSGYQKTAGASTRVTRACTKVAALPTT